MLVVIIVHGRTTSAFLILLFIFCLLLLSSHFRTPLTPLLNIFLFSRCKYKRFSLFDLLFDILSLPQCAPRSRVNSINGLRLPQHKPYAHLLPFHISSRSLGLFPTIKFSPREILRGCTDFCLTQVLCFSDDFVQSSNFLAIKEIGVLLLCRFTLLVQVAL